MEILITQAISKCMVKVTKVKTKGTTKGGSTKSLSITWLLGSSMKGGSLVNIQYSIENNVG